ncbi:MAG: sialidase family protein [Verrucomicrobiota bacterium]
MKKLVCILLSMIFFARWCVAAESNIEKSSGNAKPGKQFIAENFKRKTIYHSPQTPGYTCWLGTWFMPNKDLMITFTQNTGEIDPIHRTTEEDKKHFYPEFELPMRDATTLNKSNLFLRSSDKGATWKQVGGFRFEGPILYCSPGGQDLILKDGTILKSVYGYYQPTDPSIPQSAYLMRSSDEGKTWSKPQVLGDSSKENFRLTRIRRLHDGRLIATGGRARVPSTSSWMAIWEHFEPLLLVSEDEGKTWTGPIEVLNAEQRKGWKCEEYDTAELPNGDLVCVFRRMSPTDPKTQVRWQGLLKKTGKSWKLARLGPSPLPHSGHPELLAIKEGVILHIATSGMHWTEDGETWTPVEFPSLKEGYHSRYYPKSLQADDGTIYIFAHIGSDNNYKATDQAVVMETLKLVKK